MPDRVLNGDRWPLLFARNLFLPRDLGGNRYPYETITRLARRGHPVTVLTPRLHADFPSLEGVRYQFYGVSRRHPLATHFTNIAAAALRLRTSPPDPAAVAMAGSYDAALALSLAGVVPRIPLVFLFHSEFYSEWVQALGRGARARAAQLIRSYMAAIERRVFRTSARLVAVSRFSARQIEEREPSAAARVRVVPTGVDTRFFTPAGSRALARSELGLTPSSPLVLGVGRLVAVKQLDRLVGGFAAAVRRGLDAELAIAGDGPERARLERLASDLGVADRVHFAGYCEPERLRAFMRAADLQVCSSAFENLSLAILEGLACGTPVLGTPGGGTPEIVGEVDPALVLPNDSEAAIGAGIERLLGDAPALRALSERARAVAADRYDWERVVDGLESVCQEAMAAAGARQAGARSTHA